MSCNNEEKGEFILPTKAIAPFRKALADVLNAQREKTMEAAVALHAYITKPIDQGPGKAPRRERLAELNKALKKDNPRWHAERVLQAAFEAIDGQTNDRSYYARQPKWDDELRFQAMSLVMPYTPDRTVKFQAPKKKDLPPVPSSATVFEGSCFTIALNPKTRTIHWDVSEGNRNVEEAHESELGRAFFAQLKKVEWTRGTGGHIRYSDEYSQEAAMEHGGNPISTSMHLGPIGERIYEAEVGPAVFRRLRGTARR